jgi:hypothetical protein
LIGSLLRQQRYEHAFGSRTFSLNDLLAGPPVLPVAGGGGDGEVVPIQSLCFSGQAALARAASLREQVSAAMASPNGSAEANQLLEEIFDLVKLGQSGN